jgi:hypothetical protein
MKKNVGFEHQFFALQKTNRRLFLLLIFCICLTTYAVMHMAKPPLVIRYQPDGTVQKSNDYNLSERLQKLDIDIFIEHFILNWNFFDSFGLEENLAHAFSMMDSDLRNFYKKELNADTLSAIKASQVKTRTSIIEKSYKINGRLIDTTILYKRELIAFDDTPIKELFIRSEMVLEAQLERTEEKPYQLLVTNYKEYKLDQRKKSED